ncbi:MAG: lipopolysaccharide biosynthesis protein [Xanthomonadaceae bacterium]|nr:lipopolysaccharide biosynthesis protein [Xanthomonadaceae bacterium]
MARLLNQGLILISPIILVRLLTVEDFGRYREFVLYATLLISISGFGINSSLLRFVPDSPDGGSRFVSQSAALTFASSFLIVGGALLLDTVFAGALLGGFGIQVAIYVLFFVNLDFWEFLWLAEKRSFAVLGYTTTRLVARIAVVTTTAALTKDVMAIVWSLVALESIRLLISAAGWRARSRRAKPQGEYRWRDQLQFCLPFGGALILVAINKSLGGLFVAKLLGPVALAHYSIGVYVQPVITVLRNSLSDVLLPEMVTKGRETLEGKMALWRRSTVVASIALIGTGVVLARFAEPLIRTFFSEKYLPAVAIFQLYLLVFLRESIDFAVPLRAIDRTGPILRSNLLALFLNAALMFALLPRWGVLGAVGAFLISRGVEGIYLGYETMRAYRIELRALAPWGDLLKVLAAAGLAALVLAGSFWTEQLGLIGVVLGGAAYVALFALLLALLRVPEAIALLQYIRAAPTFVMRRLH